MCIEHFWTEQLGLVFEVGPGRYRMVEETGERIPKFPDHNSHPLRSYGQQTNCVNY